MCFEFISFITKFIAFLYSVSFILAMILILGLFELCYVGKLFKNLNNQQSHKNLLIKKLSVVALMIAINSILSAFKIPIIPNIDYLSIASLPLLIVGFMYGPFYGFLAGILGNLFYSLIALTSQFNPGFILSAGISGLVPGMLIIMFLTINTSKIKHSIKWINFICWMIIECSFIILIILKKDALLEIENKLFFTHNIICIWLFFAIGNILFLELIAIIFVLIKHKFIIQMNQSILLLAILEQTIRLCIISLLLDPIWLQETYHIDFTWIKIVKFPFELFLNLLFALPLIQIISKFDHSNFLFNILNNQKQVINKVEI